MKIDREDLLAAIDLFEAEAPEGTAVNFGTITSNSHALPPYGAGVTVTLNSPKGSTVFEKSHTFVVAMGAAITRLKIKDKASDNLSLTNLR